MLRLLRMVTITIILSVVKSAHKAHSVTNGKVRISARSFSGDSAKQKTKQRKPVVSSSVKWRQDTIKNWLEDEQNEQVRDCLLQAFEGFAEIFSNEPLVRGDYQKALCVLDQFQKVLTHDGIEEFVDADWDAAVMELRDLASEFIYKAEVRLGKKFPDAVIRHFWSLLLWELVSCIRLKQASQIPVDKEIKKWNLCLFFLLVILGIRYWYIKQQITASLDGDAQ